MHVVWAFLTGSFVVPLVFWVARLLLEANEKESADEDDPRYWQRIEYKRPPRG